MSPEKMIGRARGERSKRSKAGKGKRSRGLKGRSRKAMSWLSSLNPTPAFPEYPGPYKVGSVDVELPIDCLESASPAPVDNIGTVAFRIFYPCEPSVRHRPVRWVPGPQRGYIGAYSKFLGANPALAEVISRLPQLLNYITIPVHRSAPLLTNPNGKRWPTMIFSHGLGGSRNAYSHLCGSIASHGMVVFATDHRDGSAPASYIRGTERHKARQLDYHRIPHESTAEVWTKRDDQLKIRLWEMGLAHDAVQKIDLGTELKNLDPNSLTWRRNDHNDVLTMFKEQLDCQTPGSIAFAGHSFGGATVYQFVKSAFYRADPEKEGYWPLYTPDEYSNVVKQITPETRITLLDPWCLPIQSPATRWLADKPLPCYAPSGPGGKYLLTVLSEQFHKWAEHIEATLKIVAESPKNPTRVTKPEPHMFYPAGSAHLSQSDFGILFPWLTKKMFNAEDPERMLTLNVRAVLQVLRQSGMELANTSFADCEEVQTDDAMSIKDERGQDWKILDKNNAVRGWISIKPKDNSENIIKKVTTPGVAEPQAQGDFFTELNKDHKQ